MSGFPQIFFFTMAIFPPEREMVRGRRRGVATWVYGLSFGAIYFPTFTVVSYLNSFRIFNKIKRYHLFLQMQHNILIKTKAVIKDFP